MSLDRTRLVITALEREATVNVRSEDPSPILLQVWIDDEMDPQAGSLDSQSRPIPFIADPPMFRVEPDLSRQVRVLLVQPPENMPAGRESLFWLNLHETPANPPNQAEMENYIQLAFHVRIKLFYRPAELAEYVLSDEHKLRFSLVQAGEDGPVLQIRNPAPIHQSIGTLTLVHGDERIALETPMLAPDSQLQFPVTVPVSSASHRLRVEYSTIDDNGSQVEGEQVL